MKSNSLFSSLLFVALLCISCSHNRSFTTQGNKLIDANGQEFIIRGINNAHIWFGETAFQALDDISTTGCNTLRIVWETRGNDAELERIICRCIELNMIPMVELHDVTGNESADRLADMARWFAEPHRVDMLHKYDQFLLVNIANEWGDNAMKGDYWMDAYVRAVSIMRQAGYVNTLVIDAPGWGQNIDPVIRFGQSVIDSDSLHNILFSVHMYGSWNNPDDIRQKLSLCHQLSLPVVVGEFGYDFDEGNNNLTCRADHQMILATCNELGYGYMPWSWTGNNQANQWLDLVDNTDWKTLTWWGQQVICGKGGISQTAQPASVFTKRSSSPSREED